MDKCNSNFSLSYNHDHYEPYTSNSLLNFLAAQGNTLMPLYKLHQPQEQD
jgi:hypothetical protein